MSDNGRVASNGRAPDEERPAGDLLSEGEQIAALELAHDFPGFFPVVVIGLGASLTFDVLHDAVEEIQAGAPFRIRQRPSRHGTYVAFRTEMYVDSGRAALARRATLAALPGVIMLL